MNAGFAHRVAAAYERGTIPRRGAWAVTIAHDPNCPQRRGTGDCACSPEITARDLLSGAVVEIGMEGEAIATARTS